MVVVVEVEIRRDLPLVSIEVKVSRFTSLHVYMVLMHASILVLNYLLFFSHRSTCWECAKPEITLFLKYKNKYALLVMYIHYFSIKIISYTIDIFLHNSCFVALNTVRSTLFMMSTLSVMMSILDLYIVIYIYLILLIVVNIYFYSLVKVFNINSFISIFF